MQPTQPGLLRQLAPHLTWAGILSAAVAFAAWYVPQHWPTTAPATVPDATNTVAQPAPQKKACGKCGAKDCGCQTPAVQPAEPVKADPFSDGNRAVKPAPEPRPADDHIVDSKGVWWTVAKPNDPDQRLYSSTDQGKTWLRTVKRAEMTTCNCHAVNPGGEGLCVCHATGHSCPCTPGQGTRFREPTATAGMPAMPSGYGGGMGGGMRRMGGSGHG